MFTSFKHGCWILWIERSFDIIFTDRSIGTSIWPISYDVRFKLSYLILSELETGRRLKLSNILKIFASQEDFGIYSIQTSIESYSSLDTNNGDETDVPLILDEIDDLTSIECSLQTMHSLAFIAGLDFINI